MLRPAPCFRQGISPSAVPFLPGVRAFLGPAESFWNELCEFFDTLPGAGDVDKDADELVLDFELITI